MTQELDRLLENVFQPQVRTEVRGLLTEIGIAVEQITNRVQSGSAVWIDLLTMARNLVALIPIPTLYGAAIVAVLDWVIKFLQAGSPVALAT